MTITSLHDPWFHICQYLSYTDALRLSMVDKRLYSIALNRLNALKEEWIGETEMSLKTVCCSLPTEFVQSTINISWWLIFFLQREKIDIEGTFHQLTTLSIEKIFSFYAHLRTTNEVFHLATRFLKRH